MCGFLLLLLMLLLLYRALIAVFDSQKFLYGGYAFPWQIELVHRATEIMVSESTHHCGALA